jgi:hypothetical protein
LANPLGHDKKALTAQGSAIRGEKILTQARKYIRKDITKGSSTHNIQQYDLETNAYAVITKELRWLAASKTTEEQNDS